MAVASVWDTVNPFHMLGLTPGVPNSAQTSGVPSLAMSAGPAAGERHDLWHPDNPLFWFGALAAVTFGLVAVSTSVRVGPGRASVSLGKS